jgi:hypothetical protein
MGRIVTPPYRVEYSTNTLLMGKIRADGASRVDNRRVLLMSWRKEDGRPSDKTLEVWRVGYNQSFQPGGANAHVSEAFGVVGHIHWARVVRQRDDAVVCEVTMPMFEVA